MPSSDQADAAKGMTALVTSIRDASVLGYARGFITAYTSLDPFNANDYADRIAAQTTGDFATQFKSKENEIVIQVARAEPTVGNVLEAEDVLTTELAHRHGAHQLAPSGP